MTWAESYPAKLKADGYYMGFIGKHGHGTNFTSLFGTYDFDKGYNVQGSYFGQVIDGESAGDRHLTKFMGDLAIEFVGNAANPAKNTTAAPFCLQISFKSPHNPLQPDPAYDNLYTDDTIAHAKTDTQAQFDDLPSFIRSAGSAPGTAEWLNSYSTEQKFQDSVKKYYRLVHGVDVQIGRVLAALEDPDGNGDNSDSVTNNTIIILGSDHGYFLGERHQVGKWYIQEESIRVPLVIYDPRLPATLNGQRVSQMVLNLDIPATILDYAGISQPAVMQGRSLRPIIEGNPPADWRTVFLHDHPATITYASLKNEGVRTESFSFTRYPNNDNYKQLYDVTVIRSEDYDGVIGNAVTIIAIAVRIVKSGQDASDLNIDAVDQTIILLGTVLMLLLGAVVVEPFFSTCRRSRLDKRRQIIELGLRIGFCMGNGVKFCHLISPPF